MSGVISSMDRDSSNNIIRTETAKEAVKNGFNMWETNGDAGYTLFDRDVSVNIEIYEKDGSNCVNLENGNSYSCLNQNFFDVDINDFAGRDHVEFLRVNTLGKPEDFYFYWFKENPGRVHLYTMESVNNNFYIDYEDDSNCYSIQIDNPNETGDEKSIDYFEKVAAHELGHILGLDDAYFEDIWVYDDLNFITIEVSRPEATSVLGSNFNGWMSGQINVNDTNLHVEKSHNVEMEMVILAYFENNRQYFVPYSVVKANVNIVDILEWDIELLKLKQSVVLYEKNGTF